MDTKYKNIIKRILLKKKTISIAESFTGGLISNEFVKFSGISKSFICGIIAYSNESKIKLLKVKKINLKKYGAVSSSIAKEMATNIKKISKSDYSISTTGIAGPDGGTIEKPVGLVYICFKSNKKTKVIKKILKGTRNNIQKKSLDIVFNLLKNNI
ncbi:MAG: damage-inducible protein CinA [Pelagibacteraceae bacterium]|nr:damage-inducible protein CinA [Pelagibacteraceae bacterium]|tara:strand:- start:38186 stop:38653 length:468 start_codon:yes stop_codon:yes gene_type:complete